MGSYPMKTKIEYTTIDKLNTIKNKAIGDAILEIIVSPSLYLHLVFIPLAHIELA